MNITLARQTRFDKTNVLSIAVVILGYFGRMKQYMFSRRRLLIITILLAVVLASGFLGYYLGRYNTVVTNRAEVKMTAQDKKMTPDKDVDFKLYWQVWDILQKSYYRQPVSNTDLFYGSLSGLVAGLGDPYSVFLSPTVAGDFTEELNGNFKGIGAEISIRNDQLIIVAPLKDSPAERAGLRPGDHILAIDGIDTSFITLDQAVNLIRGPGDTEVILIIKSKSNGREPREVKIKRDSIHVSSVEWEIRSDGIAVVNLSNFNEDTKELFRRAVNDILAADTKGLILDLRNNPGGFLDTAVKVSGYWTGDQLVVSERQSSGQNIDYRAGSEPLLAQIPTVALVNEGSASASEIVAGALQDHKLATIIGKNTFGKGTVQNLEQLTDGSIIKLTIAEWLTPSGNSIEEAGIKPDIEVDLTNDDFNNDNDPQFDRAVDYLMIN